MYGSFSALGMDKTAFRILHACMDHFFGSILGVKVFYVKCLGLADSARLFLMLLCLSKLHY